MNQSLDKALHYLTGYEDIEAAGFEDLQKLADESPYFPVIQFLLAKKMIADKEAASLQQVQKTALYFSNPYWLHYQLNHEPSFDIPVTASDVSVELSANDNNATATGLASIFPVSTNGSGNSKTGTIAASPVYDDGLQNSITSAANDKTDFTIGSKINSDKVDFLLVKDATSPEIEATEVLEAMAGTTYSSDETTEDFFTDALSGKSTTAISPVAEEQPVETFVSNESNKEEAIEPDEHEKMFQNIKAMLDATTEEADAEVKNSIIPIDPYYTIDYFASQGIKLELDQNPKDRLGQNLKKFTQWLKHMKKLGPEDATEVISRTETEADIQRIADSSNTAREVVTEAMAQVLEKQGKKEKAIELYDKLSFLNPHKSAYFAAKIQQLKGS